MKHSDINKLVEQIIQKKTLVLVISILFILLTGFGVTKLTMVNNFRNFFSKQNPDLIVFDKFENIYNRQDNAVIAIESQGEHKLFTAKNIEIFKNLTNDLWATPYSRRVDTITNYQHTYAIGDELIVQDLFPDELELTEEIINKRIDIAINEPLLRNSNITPNLKMTVFTVTLEIPSGNENATTEVSDFIHATVKKYQKELPGLKMYVAGAAEMNNNFKIVARNDLERLMPYMLGAIILVMFLLLRSVSGVITTVTIIIGSVITGLGLAGWLGIKLSPPAAMAPIIIMTLAIADSMHILMSIKSYMQHGLSKIEALVKSMQDNFIAVFLTSFTTAIGFASLNFSDTPPYRAFGNIVCLGVIAAFIFSVISLPALVVSLPLNFRPKPETTKSNSISEKSADLIIKFRKSIVAITLLITTGLGFLIPTIKLDDDFIHYFDERIQYRRDADDILEAGIGLNFIDISLDTGIDQGINNPDFLNKLEEFSDWLYTQDEVINVNSINTIFKRLNKNLHEDQEKYYKIPQNKELAAQYLLLYEMSLPFGLDLTNQLNISKSSTKIHVTIKHNGAASTRDFADRCQKWLNTNTEGLSQENIITSTDVMFSRISLRNVIAMISGTALALIVITLTMMFALKDFQYGLLSLIPNLMPIIMAFGIWALIVGEAGMAIAMVASSSLGIIVDDTVHFLTKFSKYIKDGLKPRDAIAKSFHTVGKAILVTSVVLVSGFLILNDSVFAVNKTLGNLTVLTLVLALILDLSFLPALLYMFSNKTKKTA